MLLFPLATSLCSVPINEKSDRINWIQSLQHLPPHSAVGAASQIRSHQHQEIPAISVLQGPERQGKGTKTKLSTQLGHHPSQPCRPLHAAQPSLLQHSLLRTQASDIPQGTYRADVAQAAWFLALPFSPPFRSPAEPAGLLEEPFLSGKTGHERNLVSGCIFKYKVLNEGTE